MRTVPALACAALALTALVDAPAVAAGGLPAPAHGGLAKSLELAQSPGAAEPSRPAEPDPQSKLPPESIEADVSTRSVAVTSGFTGTEIIVFGTIANSRQKNSEEGLYDVVVAVEGTLMPLVARRKNQIAGIWINTQSVRFKNVPSYYAVASTRPLEDVADAETRQRLAVGFDHVVMTPRRDPSRYAGPDLAAFKNAIIRLKAEDNLYVRDDYGVSFIGRSLFRSSINLPANVPVGPLIARVFLFRDGQLLSQYSTQVRLEREGVERFLHMFSVRYPMLYGLFAVAIAVSAGLIASVSFSRRK